MRDGRKEWGKRHAVRGSSQCKDSGMLKEEEEGQKEGVAPSG